MINSNFIIRKISRDCTPCVFRDRLRVLNPHGRDDDLTLVNFEKFQRNPLLGPLRSEPTLFDRSNPSILEPPATGATTRTVTKNLPSVIVSFRFPVAPAPVSVGLAAGLAPLPLPVEAADPALVAPDTKDAEVAEPQLPGRPPILTQDVRFLVEDTFQTDALANFILKDNSDSSADTTCENSVHLSVFRTAYNFERPRRLNLPVQSYLFPMTSD